MYAFLDDGPHAGETLRITAERTGAPPRTIDLADPTAPGSGPVTYVLLGPHQNDEWWIYRRLRPEEV